jgi:predicted O-methyltransferase YrrM
VDKLSRLCLKSRLAPLLTLTGALDAREGLFQGMLYQAADALNIRLPPLYPVRYAANFSLLYAILRAATELNVHSILELGAGQSTLTLDAVRKARPDLRLYTMEADAEWAATISRRVAHTVALHHLERRTISGVVEPGYAHLPQGPFDMVIVDGPWGSRRRSRWASLAVLQQVLTDDFVVIFDDAERAGEQETIRQFLKERPSARYSLIRGLKSQCVVYSPRFFSARFI